MYHARLRRLATEGQLPKGSCSFRAPTFRQLPLTKAFCFALPVNPPPFFVSFSDLDSYLAALSDKKHDFEFEIKSLFAKKLPPVVSTACLATLFGFSPEFITAIRRNSAHYYRTFTIKKGKKERVIRAPKVALKVLQKWFGYHLDRAVTQLPCVHGFVRETSSAKAASIHCNASWVYSIDLRNFFSSISKVQVCLSLSELGYSERGSQLISDLCCFDGFLAQGSPASPILSNLIFRTTDEELLGIAGSHGIRYTRYADDLVFSGTGPISEGLESKIKAAVTGMGWEIALEKEYLSKLPYRMKVHGLLVNGAKPRLTKGYRNRIRAYLHLLANGKIAEKNMAKVMGHLAYSKMVDSL